jgi:hypothetical protein
MPTTESSEQLLSFFGFWWLVLTLVEFDGAPLEVLENWQ